MKELKFKTSKGNFLVVDMDNNDFIDYACVYDFIKLSEITEEQASEIVQAEEWFHGIHYYRNYSNSDGGTYKSAIESLHSLLKSKGIHLFENPLNTGTSIKDYDLYREAVQKTFYNPYIFKL